MIKLVADVAASCWSAATPLQLLHKMRFVNNASCDENICHQHDLSLREYKTIGLVLGPMLPPASNHSIDLEFR